MFSFVFIPQYFKKYNLVSFFYQNQYNPGKIFVRSLVFSFSPPCVIGGGNHSRAGLAQTLSDGNDVNQYDTAVQKLYVAYFNRAADPGGLNYWTDAVARLGGDTSAVSAAFAASAEYKAAYAGMSNAEIVNKVYMNLFGRMAEADGLLFWARHLDAHDISISNVVTAVAAGARGSDLSAYEAKVTAAAKFSGALDTWSAKQAYEGAAALQLARDYLSVVVDAASLSQAVAGLPETLLTMQYLHAMDSNGRVSKLSGRAGNWEGGAGGDFVFLDHVSGAHLELGGGNNFVQGSGSSLTVNGGAGVDAVILEAGDHSIHLGDGENEFRVGAGASIYTGGSGSDHLMVGAGAHKLDLGAGSNSLDLLQASASLDQYSTLQNAKGEFKLYYSSASGYDLHIARQAFAPGNVSSLRAIADAAIAHSDLSGDTRLSWFQFQGDTWLVANLHHANDQFVDGKDILLKLEGLWNLADQNLVKYDDISLNINFQELSANKIMLDGAHSAVQGSTGNDYFSANLAAADGGIHPHLQLDGGDGVDRLGLWFAQNQDVQFSSNVLLKNVEQVTLTSYGRVTLDASHWQGLQALRIDSNQAGRIVVNGDTSLTVNADANPFQTISQGALVIEGGKDVIINSTRGAFRDLSIGSLTPVSGSVIVGHTFWNLQEHDLQEADLSVSGGTVVNLDLQNMSEHAARLLVNGGAQTTEVIVKYRSLQGAGADASLLLNDQVPGVNTQGGAIAGISLENVSQATLNTRALQQLAVSGTVTAHAALHSVDNGSLQLNTRDLPELFLSDSGAARNLNWNAGGNIRLHLEAPHVQHLHLDGAGKVTLMLSAQDLALQNLHISGAAQMNADVHLTNISKIDASSAQLGQTLVLNAARTSFAGGAGDDVISFDDNSLQNLQSMDGGAGFDTLYLTASQLRMLQESGQFAQKISNFEAVRVLGGQEALQFPGADGAVHLIGSAG